MSQESPTPDRFRRRAVLELPGMNDVEIRQGIPFESPNREAPAPAPALTMDIYYPSHVPDTPPPAVIYVMGYPDPDGMIRRTGMADSWARLAAASGFAMILYANREPAGDLRRLVQQVTLHGSELGIDPQHLGLFAMSGNSPTGLRIAMEKPFRFVALNCGYTLDTEDSSVVADAARQYGFTDSCAGKSIDDLPQDLPLLLTRAGKDEFPGLNDAMDRFIALALKRNLPLTVVNHPTGPHGFDLFEDSDTSREIIRQILSFMKFHLSRD